MSRSPSDELKEAIESAASNPDVQDAMDRVHEAMLMDFIQRAEGLKGMILISVREKSASQQNVEVYAGANPNMLLGAASALVNATRKIAIECGEDEKADLFKMLAECIDELSGSEADGEVEEENFGRVKLSQSNKIN